VSPPMKILTGAVVERRRTQRGGGLERHVGVILVVASPRHRSVIITVAADGRARQECGLELATSSSPCPRGLAEVRPRMALSRTGASELQRVAPCQADPPRRSEERPAPVCQLFDGSDRPDLDSLQRRRSRAILTDSASTLSAPQAVDSGTTPRHLQSLIIRGGGAPDVHVSHVVSGSQRPTPTVAEAGGSAPEQSGERLATVEAADRSGAAPELAGSKRAPPEQGSSGRPAKKSWVRSKM
jgi:hypothetical protein